MLLKRFRLFILLTALLTLQILSAAHSVETDADLHEHHCPLCIFADANDHTSLVVPFIAPVILAECTCSFDVGTFYTPAFQANFLGRAPPVSPTA